MQLSQHVLFWREPRPFVLTSRLLQASLPRRVPSWARDTAATRNPMPQRLPLTPAQLSGGISSGLSTEGCCGTTFDCGAASPRTGAAAEKEKDDAQAAEGFAREQLPEQGHLGCLCSALAQDHAATSRLTLRHRSSQPKLLPIRITCYGLWVAHSPGAGCCAKSLKRRGK